MQNLRNVRDAVPLNWGRRQIEAFAARFAAGVGIAHGRDVPDRFERLGGTFVGVWSTFGLAGDRILVKGPKEFFLEGEHRFEKDVLGMAECLGVLCLHYPLAVERYGDDVAIGVPRYTPEGIAQVVSREAIWFGVALVMPREAFLTAHAFDPSPDALAKVFCVSRRNAESRMRSLDLLPRAEAA